MPRPCNPDTTPIVATGRVAAGVWIALAWLIVIAPLGCAGQVDDGKANAGATIADSSADAGSDLGDAAGDDGDTDGASDLDTADQDGTTQDTASGDQLGDTAPTVAKTTITSVTPSEGPTGGLTEVEIAGTLLGAVNTVYFGESPAIETFVMDDWTVRAVAPPRPAGLVDITVRSLDADGEAVDVTLPLAYRYIAKMAVFAVEPPQGDVSGGTLVTV